MLNLNVERLGRERLQVLLTLVFYTHSYAIHVLDSAFLELRKPANKKLTW